MPSESTKNYIRAITEYYYGNVLYVENGLILNK